MKDVGRVHRLEASQSLVDEILTVIIRQVLRAYHAMHVSLHELLNEINLGEGVKVGGLLYVQDGYDLPESA